MNIHVPSEKLALGAATRAAAMAIPPAWPLASSVAVNPWLDQAGEGLAMTAARMARVAGIQVTMDRGWYACRIASGAIADADLAAALAVAHRGWRPDSVAALKAAALETLPAPTSLPMIADLAANVSGIDWPAIIEERFGGWAAGWFDEGQALWAAPRGKSAYAAWRATAMLDLTPEILGLRGFASMIADAPEAADEALAQAVARLGISADARESVFHQLLTSLGGWAQAARYRLWQAEMAAGEDTAITDFLVIRLLWDMALLAQYGDRIGAAWEKAVAAHAVPAAASEADIVNAILQDAVEFAAQRDMAALLAAPVAEGEKAIPAVQMAFCIDVRSEVYRRALESVDPGIRTLGFAGFFGLTASHHRLGSDVAEHRLPVLLNAGLKTRSGGPENEAADTALRLDMRVTRAWARFKLAAVSSFAFVEAAGPTYIFKLVRDALGLAKGAGTQMHDPAPRPEPALDLATKTGMANSILRAMSLTTDFAALVVVTGHGANVVNNPHASGLHCGACGGYSGEVNARLLAGLLNEAEVRSGLVAHGINIPTSTLFVAALHDTTTDEVRLYDRDTNSPVHAGSLAQLRFWLNQAGMLARQERALRLPRAASEANVTQRSRDWAETRPEWGLAGCRTFIAAPRMRTTGRDLAGRAFLHDYDWRQDKGFGVLELIMTAPVVVASWISLQYYGSAVAPSLFGGGNKLLHNVVGGIGVVEGNGGMLRTGLPWQSVHDGEQLMHEPLRLTVCIEAPCDAMTDILSRHDGVRALFDNRWLHLFALDDSGQMTRRYAGNLEWTDGHAG